MKRLRLIGGTVFVVVLLWSVGTVILPTPAYAAPTTFTVTNTDDSGAGSLRQVIEDANSNNNDTEMDTIAFDIPGSQVHTIGVESALPEIQEMLTIDGYTQTGARENTAAAPLPFNNVITIELNMDFTGGAGLNVNGNDSVISGLSIFSTNSEKIDNLVNITATGVEFKGNYLAVRADGLTRVDSTTLLDAGVQPLVVSSGSDDCSLGGALPSERNIFGIISRTLTSGSVYIQANNCTMLGNYMGIGKDGVTSVGSSDLDPDNIIFAASGLAIEGNNNTIGGSSNDKINVISGAQANTLNISGVNNVVQGNYLGTDYTATVDHSIVNGTGITLVANATENYIGGTLPGEGNIVRNMKGAAITVNEIVIDTNDFDLALTPSKNAVVGNTISDVGILNYDVFGESNLGIDIFSQVDTTGDFFPEYFLNQGPTPNDVGDSDTGPNGYINTPVLKAAQQVGNQLTVTYDLDAADSPSDSYRVEFFANDESTIFGTGPAQTYLGAATGVTPGTDITATLTVNDDITNKALSATTTAIDNTTTSGFGSTSELARNISIGSQFDFDSDGIPNATEDLGPNNGDGNNDGNPDRQQPTITTYEIDSTGIYATLVTEGCSENGTVASIDFNSLNVIDTGRAYPYGLTDFTLNCSRGDTVDVTMYIHTDTNPELYIPRKYNLTTLSFFTIPDSTLTKENIGDSTALKLTYSITDGGDLDDDQAENGQIVDPVGLATNLGTTTTGPFAGIGVPNTGLGDN